MFENIFGFFKKVGKKERIEEKSKNTAKERLHLVLMQDRANVSADFLDMMRQEIIEVIKKYIDVDENDIDVRLTNKTNEDGTTGAPALYANIPIAGIKEETRKQEKPKIENSENKIEQTETKEDNNHSKEEKEKDDNLNKKQEENNRVNDEQKENNKVNEEKEKNKDEDKEQNEVKKPETKKEKNKKGSNQKQNKEKEVESNIEQNDLQKEEDNVQVVENEKETEELSSKKD